jgi:hypothetical protein
MVIQKNMNKDPLSKSLEQRINHKILLNKSQQGDIASTRQIEVIRKERKLGERLKTIRMQERNLEKQSRRNKQSVT